jgi:hypothetical protein
MTDLEQLIEEIRENLRQVPKGMGQIDPRAVANELGVDWSIAFDEIVRTEAAAAGLECTPP